MKTTKELTPHTLFVLCAYVGAAVLAGLTAFAGFPFLVESVFAIAIGLAAERLG